MTTPMTWPGTVPHYLREEPKMNSELALKPCPFCGNSDVEATSRVVDTNDEKTWGVDCCVTNEHELFLTKQEAIDHWNARAALSTEAQPEVTGAVAWRWRAQIGDRKCWKYAGEWDCTRPDYAEPLYPPSAIEAAVREKLEEAACMIESLDDPFSVRGMADRIRALMESPQPSVEEPAN